MIEIAKIGAPFALSGKLSLHILSTSIENAFLYTPWYIKIPNARQWSLLKNKSISCLGSKFLIQFKGINNKEDAALFTNAMIGVPRKSLTLLEEDESYWVDLIGSKVINKNQDYFGYVDYVFDTGSNTVLCCKKDKKEFLIPFIKTYIVTVDNKQKKIVVDWHYDY